MDTANKAMTAQKAMIVRPNQIIPLSGSPRLISFRKEIHIIASIVIPWSTISP